MKKIYIGSFIGREAQWYHFVSDGTREPLYAEFAKIWERETGETVSPDDVEVVGSIQEAYDYTDGINYKIVLRAPKR